MKPSKVKELAWREIDNRAVVVSPADSDVTILNETGSAIWRLIDGRRNVEAIAEELRKEYDVTVKEALADSKEFLGELEQKGLIKQS